MDIEQQTAEAMAFWRHGYAQAFMDKDPERYADQYAFPCMIRAEHLPRQVFANRAELLAYVTEMLDRAEETTWHRSSIDRLEVHLLENGLARVQCDASRYDAEDRLIARLHGNYIVEKVGGEWKMVSNFGGFYPD